MDPADFELSQIYALIDSILPFEACLYYQVLPLTIEGTRLVIGMVDPRDYAAEEYVRRQLAFINYSITTRPIASDWHRNLLSQYLSHTAQRRQEGASSPQGKAGAKPANPDASAKDTPQAATSKTAAQGPTATGPAKADKPAPASGQGTASPSTTPPTAPPRSPSGSPPEDLAATYVVDQPDELEATLPRPPRPTSPASPPASPTPAATGGGGNAPLHLYIDERYESLDEATLATLQPKELMQALLSKVLQEGIGRLY
ncbi:MAG: hypothetical protein O3C67_02890, partial [Cyanobacteria bacterium]|nr:hypothetical protein [Cyanobacteriota bacterium]